MRATAPASLGTLGHMATEDALLARVRLELGDPLEPFQSAVVGEGTLRSIELPNSPVVADSVSVMRVNASGSNALVAGTDYVLDADGGYVMLADPLAVGDTLVSSGFATKYFTDVDLLTFISTAALQHLHNRQGVSLSTLPVVEEYPLVLLAVIEALYALLNDAAFDIDVSTPEGVGIPRSQRFRQLMELIEQRKGQYAELCAALNVGLSRIEVSTLRRVSRTTNRLVPVYLPQEIEDRQPPVRVFVPIDTNGGAPIEDGFPVQDIEVYEYGYYTEQITIPGGVPAGWKVDARIRRYKDSSSLREFIVTVDDATAGLVTLDLTPLQTAQLPQRLFYDIRLTNRATREVRTIRKGTVTCVQQVGVDEAVGPSTGGGY